MKSVILSLIMLVLLVGFAQAEACQLSASLVNQDPSSAVPGDYVKLVFQLDGIENPTCGEVYFELVEKYPLTFDPSQQRAYEVQAGTFTKDFSSFLLATYKVRVDTNALDGSTPVEVRYMSNYNVNPSSTFQTKEFNIDVQDVRSDFEVFVKNYDAATNIITFDILNIGQHNVEALTFEVPQQENITVKGANTNIVGNLDSNDDTTTDFEAIPKEGLITVNISYSDTTNTRRTLEKTVQFKTENFTDRKASQTSTSWTTYLFWIVVIALVGYWIYRRVKKSRAKKLR